ncbi:hypothetical protein [Nodularia spumigena]|uniref:hypothetical protein n=2 Tax=Cyanobacteriota TaxID=1117 RepID=UPI002330D0F3|nr:hypothetical protein [Nodularia spumigena]MDB9358130.1 hypothetical protein [Nodularia spumigena CS-587/03]MDB9398865.1 hypothetical protein [Microcystis aeruginosa CS-567/02-A1]MDB9530273.1 hypothetical protein [Nodularia spumigena CS-1038]MDB9338667.1 hypothetical protein [Nodularia spumigena CS-589/07]MDB9497714.1 hypothetical protein [Nodularia spumigena CS-336/02]
MAIAQALTCQFAYAMKIRLAKDREKPRGLQRYLWVHLRQIIHLLFIPNDCVPHKRSPAFSHAQII